MAQLFLESVMLRVVEWMPAFVLMFVMLRVVEWVPASRITQCEMALHLPCDPAFLFVYSCSYMPI